jgi:formimidoylglutamate deiminase
MTSSLKFEHLLTPQGIEHARRIVIDAQGVITAIEPASPPYDGVFAVAGMPNAHSHAFQRVLIGVRDAGDAGSFWSWRDAMYAVASRITPEQLEVIAGQAFREMLAAGYTSVAEFHYLHHLPDGRRGLEMAQAIIAAARTAGIRLTLLPVLYQRGGFDRPPLVEQQRFLYEALPDYLEFVRALRERCVLGIAPHSLRAVSFASLRALRDALAKWEVNPDGNAWPIHIHISEQRREVDECRQLHGRSPIEALHEEVGLGPQWHLVHATHATPHELELVRTSHANVVLCPLTEAQLGDGFFPAVDYGAGGGRFAIGSDSNARIDAVEELRLAELGQRLRLERRVRLGGPDPAGSLWALAARQGGRALGQNTGALAPGYFADVVVLDHEAPIFAGLAPEAWLDAWLLSGSAAEIAACYVGGHRHERAPSAARGTVGPRFARVMRELLA